MRPMTGSPVVISGVGVLSPLGNSVAQMARRFAAGGRACESEVDGERMVQIENVPFDLVPAEKKTRLGRLDRFCRMVLSASCLAVDSAGLSIPLDDGERAGISVGTGFGCLLTDEQYFRRVVERGPTAASPQVFSYTVSNAAAGEVSIALGIKGPNVTSHMGFAAGLGALGYGFDLIEMGKADVVVAGGADVIGAPVVRALRAMSLLKSGAGARPHRDRAPGVWPAEGAAFFVLERAERAARRGAPVWARIDAYAAGFEPRLARREPAGDGAARTMRRALQAGGIAPAAVDVVVSSAHGTPLDGAERDALAEVLGGASPVTLLCPKQALGETFAAASLLGLALVLGLAGGGSAAATDAAFDLSAVPLAAARAAAALSSAGVFLVSNPCYTGNVVALVGSRG